jgi:glycosyltransferase involved in cell wall biosynthesis
MPDAYLFLSCSKGFFISPPLPRLNRAPIRRDDHSASSGEKMPPSELEADDEPMVREEGRAAPRDMSKRLLLSIALATYNGERYLEEQLESIVRQTRLPDELVIFDDASTDSTASIVGKFAQRAPFPVRFQINAERLGSTRNFEAAIRACSGDIIFLCDQDDVWYPQKMARMEERFISDPEAGAVFTDADIVDQDLQPCGPRLWQAVRFKQKDQARFAARDALGVLLKRPVVTGATMAFRSSYRDLILPMPAIWVHDAWISLLIGAVSHLDGLPIPLIAYRQHSANQIGAPRRDRRSKRTKSSCAAFYGPQVPRFEMARARLAKLSDSFPQGERSIQRFDDMLPFVRARAALPDARWRRLPGALHELVALRYHRHAYGLKSFRRDLLR